MKKTNFSKKFDTAYSKLSEVKLLTIGLASPEKIRQWAEKTLPNRKILGQVTNANTLHHKTFKPQKGGLFCERIFGPLKDFQCACGIVVPNPQGISGIDGSPYSPKGGIEVLVRQDLEGVGLFPKGGNRSLGEPRLGSWLGQAQQSWTDQAQKEKNSSLNTSILTNIKISTLQGPNTQTSRRFCKKCDVEYTWSVIRRYQLGYIQLVSPVTHIWYLKGNPSYLSILLDMKKRHIEFVTYCTESITLENAIKESNRISKIPSEMLKTWEKTVKNGWETQVKRLSRVKTPEVQKKYEAKRISEKYVKRKKEKRQETKVQKRQLPLAILTRVNSYVFPSGMLGKSHTKGGIEVLACQDLERRISLFTVYKKYRILFSLIQKSIYESLLLDLELESSRLINSYEQSRLVQDLNSWSWSEAPKGLPQVQTNRSLGALPLDFYSPLGNKQNLSLTKVSSHLSVSWLGLDQQADLTKRKKESSLLSIKKFLKKLPTSLYLFLNLQLIFQKQFLIAINKKFWKEIYFNSIKRSFQLLFFLERSTKKKTVLSMKLIPGKRKSVNIPSIPSLINKHKIILKFLSIVKRNWFSAFLNYVRTIPIREIEINNKLITNYEFSKNKMIELFSTNLVNACSPKKPIHFNMFNFYSPLGNRSLGAKPLGFYYFGNFDGALPYQKGRQSPVIVSLLSLGAQRLLFPQRGNSHTNNSVRFLIPILNKLSETLLHAFFSILVEEKLHSNLLVEKSVSNSSLNKNVLRSKLKLKYSISPKGNKLDSLKGTNLINKKQLKTNFLLLARNLIKINRIFNSPISGRKNSQLLERFPSSFQKMVLTKLKNNFSGEYICNQFISISNSNNYLNFFPNIRRLQNVDTVTSGETTLGEKSSSSKGDYNKAPKLVNNIYSVSHRERWVDEEWQNFNDYMSIPFNSNQSLVNLNKVSDQKKLNLSFSAGNIKGLLAPLGVGQPLGSMPQSRLRIPAYQNRIFNVKDEFLFYQNKNTLEKQINSGFGLTPNYACFSGPGIIQQLLNEFDFSEQGKLDKQNRILLYQLNKHIFTLKKRVSKSARKELKECYKKRDQLIRRTKLIRTFFRKDSIPNSMILTILPVLPPDLRPIVKIGGQIAASDLNRLYQRVIYRNDRLKKFLKEPATSSSYEMKYAQRLLQEAVDNLIQNGRGTASEKDARGRALKSLSDLLKGKQGRFRQYLLGKRVDYSGRSVIVVGPKLKLHECGLPKEMALELYLPFLLKRILNHNYARTVVGAKTLMKKNPDLVWELLKEIMQTCPILLNRAPTLHRLGIQAFQPKLIEGRAILLHPLVCPAFNADFDGDQMAVHVPITVEARAEAWKLMCARQNFLSPATGEPLAIPSQDMVLGCYYLTTHCNKFSIKNQKGSGFFFSDFSDVLNAYRRQIIDLHAFVWVKFDGHLEQGNDQDDPIEIRINSYGNWNEIYQFIQKNYSKNNLVNQYLCTTPGRILFNFFIQKSLLI